MSGIKLYDKNGNHAEITSDGKLKVDAVVNASIAESKYRPNFEYSKNDLSLSKTSYTDIFTVNGELKLDNLDLRFDRDDVFIQIEVDGNIIFDEELERLRDSSDYNLDWQGGNEDDDD